MNFRINEVLDDRRVICIDDMTDDEVEELLALLLAAEAEAEAAGSVETSYPVTLF